MTGDDGLDPAAMSALLDVAGGDLDFVDDLAQTYLEDAPLRLAALDDAAAAGDPAGLVAPAHTLKSSSASMGAVRLADLARELEAAARNGAVPDALDRVAAMRAEYERVAAALSARPWREAS